MANVKMSDEVKNKVMEMAKESPGLSSQDIYEVIKEVYPEEAVSSTGVGFYVSKARNPDFMKRKKKEVEVVEIEEVEENSLTVDDYWQMVVEAKQAHIDSLEAIVLAMVGHKKAGEEK